MKMSHVPTIFSKSYSEDFHTNDDFINDDHEYLADPPKKQFLLIYFP